VRLRLGAEKMEPTVIAPSVERILPTVDRTDVTERRVGERRLHELLAPATDIPGWMPPRRERRRAHVFQAAEGFRDEEALGQAPCLVCGYAETGHPTLTDPEREIVTALVNQRQAPAFMRRSILRKLASSLHRR
jgi:hypothetical protein